MLLTLFPPIFLVLLLCCAPGLVVGGPCCWAGPCTVGCCSCCCPDRSIGGSAILSGLDQGIQHSVPPLLVIHPKQFQRTDPVCLLLGQFWARGFGNWDAPSFSGGGLSPGGLFPGWEVAESGFDGVLLIFRLRLFLLLSLAAALAVPSASGPVGIGVDRGVGMGGGEGVGVGVWWLGVT